jgi:hypothetical protein
MLGGALAILGIVFLFSGTVKRYVSVGLLVASVAAGAASFPVGASQTTSTRDPTGASVEILSPADGDTVPADKDFRIRYRVKTGQLGNLAGDMHVYVDDALQSMQVTKVLTATIPRGQHKLSVELADDNHLSFDPPVIDTIEITGK